MTGFLVLGLATVPMPRLFAMGNMPGMGIASNQDIQVMAELNADSLNGQRADGIADLAALFRSEQSQWLRITPPGSGIVLDQDEGIVVFDPSNFPDSFTGALIGDTENDCPVYTLTLAEDPITRDTLFLNADGAVIYSAAPEPGYDPYWLLNEYYPDLYSGLYGSAEIQELKRACDPSLVRITLKLLPAVYVDQYALGMAENESAAGALAAPGRRMVPLMMYQGPAVSNLQFTAIERKTNGVMVTLAYPTDFTNRVDVFTCSDLIGFWWGLAVCTNVNTSQDWLEWLDTNAPSQAVRFYAAGNADLDSDSDGLSDDRERFLYHTSPTNGDSDCDGLGDYDELMTLHTDPNNSKTNKPDVWITYPVSESRKVWLP